MLSYVLIENQLIYDTLLRQLKKNEQKNDENINKLIDFAQCLKNDFKEIWLVYNYEKGVEVFISRVDERIQELRAKISM